MEQNELESMREEAEDEYVSALMGLGLTEEEAEYEVDEYLESELFEELMK